QRLDVPLHTHIAKDQQRRAHWRFPERGVRRYEKCNADFGLNAIAEQVDYLDMQVRRLKIMPDAQFDLLRLDVAESSLDGFFHGAGKAAGHLQLSCSDRNRDFHTIESNRAIRRHACGINSAWRQGIARN